MLELLKPSLPGAARALADMARFRLQVALTPSARQPALLAQRFMTPTRRDKPVSASAVMADLQRFAPDWASRLAVQGDLPSRVESLFERMHTETLATPARDGAERLQLYRWTPPRGKATPARHALLSHGWESYALSYALVIERLLALGYTVHAMDHAAHGASEGRVSGLPRFAEAVRDVTQHLAGQGIGIELGVGHSLGGGAWLMACTRLGVTPQRLLLLAPFIDTPELLDAWLKLHGLSSRHRPDMQQAMQALHGPSPMDFPDMAIETLARRLTVPTTIVQDPADFIAPMKHSRRLAKASAQVRCVPAAGAGHVGVLSHPTVLDALVPERVAA
ncbi:hypothetical protein OSTOST_12506 [Ostertagia ostertagi]